MVIRQVVSVWFLFTFLKTIIGGRKKNLNQISELSDGSNNDKNTHLNTRPVAEINISQQECTNDSTNKHSSNNWSQMHAKYTKLLNVLCWSSQTNEARLNQVFWTLHHCMINPRSKVESSFLDTTSLYDKPMKQGWHKLSEHDIILRWVTFQIGSKIWLNYYALNAMHGPW